MYQEIAQLLKRSKRTTILTGAGISTNSGLKDYRSNGGLWNGVNPLDICSINSIGSDEFTTFYRNLAKEVSHNAPNESHRIIQEWQQKGIVGEVITQNIDGYHGTSKVTEVHGSLRQFYCTKCGAKYTREEYLRQPKCGTNDFSFDKGYSTCGGTIRPDIVLFGETPRHIEKAIVEMATSDVVMVIGTSLSVAPVRNLPVVALQYGADVIAVNNESIWLSGVTKHNLIGEDITVALNKLNSYMM
jgi:NAD-dependent deacetylase